MGNYYILDTDGKTPIAETDVVAWAKWYEKADRKVARTEFRNGEISVSTVFLSIDHAFGGGVPVLWETMAFGGSLDQEQDRYATHAAAVEGHEQMVERVKAELVAEKAKGEE